MLLKKEIDEIKAEVRLYKNWYHILEKVEEMSGIDSISSVKREVEDILEEKAEGITTLLTEAYERVSEQYEITKKYQAMGYSYLTGWPDEYYIELETIEEMWEKKAWDYGENGRCSYIYAHAYCDTVLNLPVAFIDVVIDDMSDVFQYLDDDKSEIEIIL